MARLAEILPQQDVAGQNGIVSHLAKIVFACGKVVREVMEPDQSVWEYAACLADVMDTTTWPAEMIKSTRMQSWWNSSLSIQRMMISAWLRVEPPASPSATAVPLLQLEAPKPPAGTAGAGLEDPPTGPAPADGATTSRAPDSAQDPGPTTGDGGGPPTGPSGDAPVLHAVPLPHGGPVVEMLSLETRAWFSATLSVLFRMRRWHDSCWRPSVLCMKYSFLRTPPLAAVPWLNLTLRRIRDLCQAAISATLHLEMEEAEGMVSPSRQFLILVLPIRWSTS